MSSPTSPSDVGTGVHKADEPTVANLVWRALRLAFADAEFLNASAG
jgi:hypothetical protein